MRAVIQRVSQARVEVAGEVVGAIERGLMVLLGVSTDDTDADAAAIADKIANLRVFGTDDEPGGMERSVSDIGGSVLLVSQFTLMGDCRKGRRPSWILAAPPDEANRLYEKTVAHLRERGIIVATGVFRTTMQVHLVNEGPVTVLVDTKKAF